MKVVVVETKDGESTGARIVVLVPSDALWAFRLLCARAHQQVLSIKDEAELDFRSPSARAGAL